MEIGLLPNFPYTIHNNMHFELPEDRICREGDLLTKFFGEWRTCELRSLDDKTLFSLSRPEVHGDEGIVVTRLRSLVKSNLLSHRVADWPALDAAIT